MKASKFIVSLLCILIVLVAVASRGKELTQAQNNAPVVKLISPKSHASFAANALVNYEITVADKEDGDSKYDEINTKEIMLEVRYYKDSSEAVAQLNNREAGDPTGLAAIRSSNCFNCHSFNSKGIGPSFADICKKYPFNPANTALLTKRVKEGATGTWGKVTMPTHPELTPAQAQSMVNWLLQNANNASINYYIGATGNFRLGATGGSYLLTASYIDHGTKQDSTKHLKGMDVIVINGR